MLAAGSLAFQCPGSARVRLASCLFYKLELHDYHCPPSSLIPVSFPLPYPSSLNLFLGMKHKFFYGLKHICSNCLAPEAGYIFGSSIPRESMSEGVQ